MTMMSELDLWMRSLDPRAREKVEAERLRLANESPEERSRDALLLGRRQQYEASRSAGRKGQLELWMQAGSATARHWAEWIEWLDVDDARRQMTWTEAKSMAAWRQR